jgi:hypothetical protein
MIPYNAQNNDAGFAVQKTEVVEQLKIHSTLIGQRISTNISNFSTCAFCTANPARGYILAEFCHSLTDFRANLSSLFKASLFRELYGIILAGDID